MVRVGLAIAAITWVPLAVLALVDGAAAGRVLVPLRDSFGTHVRLLLAIPLFFFAEWLFTERVGAVLRELLPEGHHHPGRRTALQPRRCGGPSGCGRRGSSKPRWSW